MVACTYFLFVKSEARVLVAPKKFFTDALSISESIDLLDTFAGFVLRNGYDILS